MAMKSGNSATRARAVPFGAPILPASGHIPGPPTEGEAVFSLLDGSRATRMASEWHAHDDGQLVCCRDGTMTVRTTGGCWVVPADRAVWIPPGMHHQVSSTRNHSFVYLYAAPGWGRAS